MGRTDNLESQHKEILECVGKISELLIPDELSRDSSQISSLLPDLVRTLEFHLKMEDDGLYPPSLRHPHAKVRPLAEKYSAEMGDIKDKVKLEKDDYVLVIDTKTGERGILEGPLLFTPSTSSPTLCSAKQCAGVYCDDRIGSDFPIELISDLA